MKTEIDNSGKKPERRKVRSFGGDPAVREREAERNHLKVQVGRILELTDCSYKTLLLQIKADHYQMRDTLKDVRVYLTNLSHYYDQLDKLDEVKVTTEEE
jgi:hypothetical protein